MSSYQIRDYQLVKTVIRFHAKLRPAKIQEILAGDQPNMIVI
ncbi:hypothetical protein WJM97_22520 [Okeanomitos corallinicola TIOX110]|uniref:Uncharacterized protein n=1 Tax=Okeanomitos corallinicola TIOX110 TaxID=3133117 RepID=A0ABZ2UV79_9CYAN